MLTTTKARLRAHHACEDKYEYLCSWAPEGDDTPILLEDILERNGPADALWALRALDDDGGLARWLLRWCAAQVAPLWDAPEIVCEYLRTGDDSLRVAAGVAADAANATWAACWAAADVARAAADAADAADAAWAAAWAAARTAQSECMRSAIARIRAGEPLGGIEC